MMLERVRAWALAAIAAGADVDLDDVHHRFAVWLDSEGAPAPDIDAEQAELMSVLGVGPWRR